MFQKLITYSIHHKMVVGILTVALAVWGIWSLVHLPFDSTPDITNNQVQVITQAPSLGAQEVEQYITSPIEMALANIPRQEERRSISRSGLSVVTLVFDDGADIYWARSQISQVLEAVAKELPANADTELGPIATGLGEIFHYTVRPEKGYEDRYSLTQLRTIQDWIVRKQLAGTPGVAEVSGWGGYVKQYEVAVDTDQLNANGLTISDLFDALQRNNANTGGSYIEQNSNQYYIRGLGVVKSFDDIANITVKTIEGTPVRIKDVAKVQEGHATRFGAVTRNGEGEVVAGIAIMLKGENFQQVIKNVKERINQIQKSLPEGVVIEPFIDRTNLVERVEGTIAHNLIAGGLIVIFVLVLFLGNWRAGHSAEYALCLCSDESLRCGWQPDESGSHRLRNDSRFGGYHRRGCGDTYQQGRFLAAWCACCLYSPTYGRRWFRPYPGRDGCRGALFRLAYQAECSFW